MPKCRSCGAESRWAKTPAGKAPLESLQPSPEAPRYLSHFATCPSAGLHRRK